MSDVLNDKITESELAKELHRTRRTLQDWRKQRTGPPYIRLGRQILYRRQAVQEWLDSLEQEQPRARRSA